jgi:hypothetical protein
LGKSNFPYFSFFDFPKNSEIPHSFGKQKAKPSLTFPKIGKTISPYFPKETVFFALDSIRDEVNYGREQYFLDNAVSCGKSS